MIHSKIRDLEFFDEIDKTNIGPFMNWIRDAHTRTVVLAPYFRTFRTEYKEYGARRPSYLGSTDFSTGYGHFFKHEVRRVRSTRSTVLQEYELKYQVRSFFLAQSTEYGEYRTSGVRI